MIESLDIRRDTVLRMGQVVHTNGAEMHAIAAEELKNVQVSTSNSVYQAVEYYMQCVVEDVESHNIVTGSVIVLPNYLHKFRLNVTSIMPDIYGWVKLVGALQEYADD